MLVLEEGGLLPASSLGTLYFLIKSPMSRFPVTHLLIVFCPVFVKLMPIICIVSYLTFSSYLKRKFNSLCCIIIWRLNFDILSIFSISSQDT